MTQEEKKQLLIKDLCSRVMYGVICSVTHKKNGELVKEDMKLSGIFEDGNFYFLDKMGSTYSDNYIPYLRPISSITKEEESDLRWIAHDETDGYCTNDKLYYTGNKIVYLDYIPDYIDFMHEHHLDYRGLIEEGLVLEAPEGMYNN